MNIKDIRLSKKAQTILLAAGCTAGAVLIGVSALLLALPKKPLPVEGDSSSGLSSAYAVSSGESEPAGETGTTAGGAATPDSSGGVTKKTTSGPTQASPAPPEPSGVNKPTDKPVSAQVKMENGLPKLYINGKQNPPLMIFGNVGSAYSRKTVERLENEWAYARDSGVNIASVYIEPAWMISHERFDTAELDRALMSVLSVNPDSFILLRVGLSLGGDWDGNPGKMWLDKNPDDRWKAVNGSTGNEDTVSWASDKWFKDNNGYDALGILSKIIDYINSDPYYAARVVGYHPCVGEWFEPYCREKGADASVTNTKKFRAWLKDKYKTDAALKAAWADGTATLASAAVPDVPGNGGRTETRSLLTEKSDTRTIDFYEYTQWLVASRIKEFNKLVKQKTNNRCLTVAFYGYEMEVVTPLSGHNAVEALLQDKNMDALVSPISYHDRNEGGLGGFMSPVDAVQSAGKLWIVEDDIRLLNNPDDPDASYNPAAGSVAAALEIHKREMGALLIRGAGTWFMDLWGSGWLDHPDIWKNIGNLYPLYTSYTGKMTVSSGDKTAFRPQVAVILDEDGSYRYAMPMKTGFDSLSYGMREELYRAGLTYGFYTTADLVKGTIPSSVKLFLFPNAFHIDDKEMQGIKAYQKNGNTLFFLGGFGDNSAARITEMTGMTANKSGTMTSNIVLKGSHALTAGLSSVAPSFLTNPSWSITNATVLGQSEGLNTLAVKENNGWKSVYMGAAKPDRAFLRNLAKFAGANVFMTSGDTFFGNDNLVVVHTQKNASGTRKVTFPSKCDVYDYFRGKWYTGVSSIDLPVEGAKTYYLFYGDKAKLTAQGYYGMK